VTVPNEGTLALPSDTNAVPFTGLWDSSGSVFYAMRSARSLGDAVDGSKLLATAGWAYDGSTWTRVYLDATGKLRTSLYAKTSAAGDQAVEQVTAGSDHPLKTLLYDSAGGQLFPAKAAAADGLANPSVTEIGTLPSSFNGTTWDRLRGNVEGTLLASAARTSTTTFANQVNYNHRFLVVVLNVTAASGTGGLTLQIWGIDPVTGATTYTIAVGNTYVTTGIRAFIIGPGVSNAGGFAGSAFDSYVGAILPRNWAGRVFHTDGTSYTYTVGYSLIN